MTNDIFKPTKGAFEPTGFFDKVMPKVEEDTVKEEEEIEDEEKDEEE